MQLPRDGAHGADGLTPMRMHWIVGVLCFAQLILAVDITIILVANATIERSLGFTPENIQWIVTAYSLTFGGFLLLGGRLGDYLERRNLFALGMAAFVLASLGAGLARSVPELITFRALQGLSGAIVSPAALASLGITFPEDGPARRRAYALWSAAGSAGGIIGYTAGGAIVANFGWRWIFFINLPIGAAAIVVSRLVLPRVAPTHSRSRPDVLGALTATLGVGFLIYGLGNAETAGWGTLSTVLAFLISAVLLGSFVVTEHRVANPLLPFTVLRRRAAVGNVIVVLQASIVTGAVFLLSLYMQQVFHYSPQHTGLATLPIPIGVAVGAFVSSKAMRRIDARNLATGGLLLLALAMAWLARLPNVGSYRTAMLPGLALLGFALAITNVPLINVTTSGGPADSHGIIAGVYNMSQQMGSAIGLAALATIAAAAAPKGFSAHFGEAHGIRVSFVVTAAMALSAGAIARFGLPSRRPLTWAPAVGPILHDAIGTDAPAPIDTGA